MLVSRLKREEDTAVREGILNTLVRLNDPSAAAWPTVFAAKMLPCAMKSSRPSSRWAAKWRPFCESLLADPDPDVRIFVVNILDSERHPDVENWLIEGHRTGRARECLRHGGGSALRSGHGGGRRSACSGSRPALPPKPTSSLPPIWRSNAFVELTPDHDDYPHRDPNPEPHQRLKTS
jgi:hypothetical protein